MIKEATENSPLLGVSKVSNNIDIPKNANDQKLVTLFRDISIGLVNSILTIPCMVGYAAIIFSDLAFRPYVPMLAKLILFSAVIHQVVFCLLSSLPFAIGQVQDAGLIFLAAIAISISQRI